MVAIAARARVGAGDASGVGDRGVRGPGTQVGADQDLARAADARIERRDDRTATIRARELNPALGPFVQDAAVDPGDSVKLASTARPVDVAAATGAIVVRLRSAASRIRGIDARCNGGGTGTIDAVAESPTAA